MIHLLKGVLVRRADNYFVVLCNGIGFKVFSNKQTLATLPADEASISVFTSLFIRDDHLELFGFLDVRSLEFFELLNSVSGVGPRTALGVLDVDTVPRVLAAIAEKRVDILTRVPGVGKKTAERVILELQGKVDLSSSPDITRATDLDYETEDVLCSLGYPRVQVKKVLQELAFSSQTSIEERVRASLKVLGKT